MTPGGVYCIVKGLRVVPTDWRGGGWGGGLSFVELAFKINLKLRFYNGDC